MNDCYSRVDSVHSFSFQRVRAQHIVPCTISQLLSATLTDEVFRIGDVEISQVCKILEKGHLGIRNKGLERWLRKHEDQIPDPDPCTKPGWSPWFLCHKTQTGGSLGIAGSRFSKRLCLKEIKPIVLDLDSQCPQPLQALSICRLICAFPSLICKDKGVRLA